MEENNKKPDEELWDDDPQTSSIYTRSFINDLLGKDSESDEEGDSEEISSSAVKPKKKKKLWLIPVIIIALLIIFCAVTYFILPGFMVEPNFNKEAYQELLNSPSAKAVSINGKYNLSGWFIDYAGTRNLVIYFGGISEDASTAALRMQNQQTMDKIFTGYDIAVIDWPEYGKSSGKANETSLKEAAVMITRYYKNRDDIGNIVIIGYSMGTGPAVYAASQVGCNGLILLAPYYNANDLYNNVVNIFHGPLELLQSYKMPANEFASGVKVKPLIVASDTDSRVPYDSSVRLSEMFPGGSIVMTLEAIDHGSIPEDYRTLQYIKKYLNR